MKAPIITNENGDISFFASIQNATSYIEPIDIRNDEYEIYDSEGIILKCIATKHGIRIIETKESSKKDKLMSILKRFYITIGLDPAWVENATLSELITLGIEEYETN